MKLFNILKKETSKERKSNIQKMDKNQLSSIIGGGDGTSTYAEVDSTGKKKGGNVTGNIVISNGNL